MSIIGRITIVASFFVGAAATTCPAGKKAVTGTATTSTYCTGEASDSSNCPLCCVDDDTKCGGQTPSCAAGKFVDPAKAGDAATSNTAAANCCTDQAACPTAGAGCAPGYKARSNAATLKCSTAATDAASCSSTCCEPDDTKCGGQSPTCAAGKFRDPSKFGDAATASTAAANCCTDEAACPANAAGCAPGWKAKTNAGTLKCTSAATTVASCLMRCCDMDDTKCGGITTACGNNQYNTGGSTAATSSNFAATCCSASPTCQAFYDYSPPTPAGTASSAEHLKPIMATLFAALAVMAV